METLRAYWHVSDNFGDALTPYLIKKISEKDVVFAKYNSKPSPFMVTGSILGYNLHRGIVWGNGCAFKSDLDPECFAGPSEELKIIATRGQLSKELVKESGHQPLAVGDPGILLPRFYKPTVEKKYKLGIMCSWVDYDQVVERYGDGYVDNKVTFINSMGAIEDIIDRICECEILASSTLHGFIAAVAYQVPTLLVKFSDKMIGDGFKYRDFYTCLDRPFKMLDLRKNVISISELAKQSAIHNLSISADDLFNCCPFKEDNDSSLQTIPTS